jgi:phosphatidylglycerol:prolipoprotein diacylglycerol transferase
MLAILFPQIDPVLIQIGPLSMKWYGIAYAVGIIISAYLLQKFSAYRWQKFHTIQPITSNQIDSLYVYIILGIILGGRLGYVIFYRPEWFITRPLMVLNTLEGGMSFHGGMIGYGLAVLIFSYKNKISALSLSDLICCAVPIALFFGRCANFINGELYGRITTVEWGVIFPHAGSLPRHPSQLYEAATEGLLLFIVLMILLFKTKLSIKRGALTGCFAVGYAIARIFVEEYREPDLHIGFFMIKIWDNFNITITTGQLLTIPMLIGGVALIFNAKQVDKIK